ncbi:MAG TPA: hypothetical protein VNX86_11110 [Rhizomicrobium sp.]|nr:hypothetical protein [Rhizomicrobium sp.]
MADADHGCQPADWLRAFQREHVHHSQPTLFEIDAVFRIDSRTVFIDAFRETPQPASNGSGAEASGNVDGIVVFVLRRDRNS